MGGILFQAIPGYFRVGKLGEVRGLEPHPGLPGQGGSIAASPEAASFGFASF